WQSVLQEAWLCRSISMTLPPQPRDPTTPSFHRRAFLARATEAVVPVLSFPHLANLAQAQAAPKPGPPALIVRQAEPPNLEVPFATLNSFITPNQQFFVRNHFR